MHDFRTHNYKFNIYFAENVGKSEYVFKAFSFNYFPVITGP